MKGYADVSLLDTSLYLETPIGEKASIAIGGRKSYVGAIIEGAVPKDSGVNVISAPRYWDYQILARYRPAPAHEIRAFAFASDDELQFLFSKAADARANIAAPGLSSDQGFYRYILSYNYTPNKRFQNRFRFSSGSDRSRLDIGDLFFRLDAQQTQIRNDVTHQVASWLTLNYGADLLFQRTEGAIRLPLPPNEGQPTGGGGPPFSADDIRFSAFDETFYAPAAYFEAEFKPTADLRLLPAVRLEHFSRIDETVASPRFTVRNQLSKTFTAKGGVGYFVQEPFFDKTDENFGNPALGTKKTWQYAAGFEYRPRPHLSVDATVFYKHLWDMVSPTDVQTTGLLYDNNGKGSVLGLEMVLRHEFANHFSGWVAYTLSRARRTDSGAEASRPFDFDQPHILTVVGTYELPRNWQIGGRFRLVSGNPRTPVVGAFYDASADRYDPVFGPVNAARNGAFHQLDLRIDKTWISRYYKVAVYLDIQNVYNRANPEQPSYNFNFRRTGVQQSLPLFPILGSRIDF